MNPFRSQAFFKHIELYFKVYRHTKYVRLILRKCSCNYVYFHLTEWCTHKKILEFEDFSF